jgi:hypothetical protein
MFNKILVGLAITGSLVAQRPSKTAIRVTNPKDIVAAARMMATEPSMYRADMTVLDEDQDALNFDIAFSCAEGCGSSALVDLDGVPEQNHAPIPGTNTTTMTFDPYGSVGTLVGFQVEYSVGNQPTGIPFNVFIGVSLKGMYVEYSDGICADAGWNCVSQQNCSFTVVEDWIVNMRYPQWGGVGMTNPAPGFSFPSPLDPQVNITSTDPVHNGFNNNGWYAPPVMTPFGPQPGIDPESGNKMYQIGYNQLYVWTFDLGCTNAEKIYEFPNVNQIWTTMGGGADPQNQNGVVKNETAEFIKITFGCGYCVTDGGGGDGK